MPNPQLSIPDVWGKNDVSAARAVYVIRALSPDVAQIPLVFYSHQQAEEYMKQIKMNWAIQGVEGSPLKFYKIERIV